MLHLYALRPHITRYINVELILFPRKDYFPIDYGISAFTKHGKDYFIKKYQLLNKYDNCAVKENVSLIRFEFTHPI